MFGQVAAFEFRQQIRSPLFWVVTAIFFLLTFGFMASDQIHIGDTGNVNKNAPYATIQVSLVMGVFFMFASTAFVAGAVLRDDETRFGGSTIFMGGAPAPFCRRPCPFSG